MKNVIIKLTIILVATCFASCKTMYRPNLAYAPVFKEKKTAQTDVLIGSNGGELQVGYAVSDNWAIVASGIYDVSKATFMDSIYGVKDGNTNYSNYSAELGLGYYKWLRKDSTYCFSLYGGGGYGKTKGYSDVWFNPDFVSYSGNYYKLFWQPTITYSKQYVDLSFASRFRILSYTTLSNSRAGKINTGVDAYLEPLLSLKAGGEQFKLHLQLGTSFPFQQQNNYTTSKLLFSIGFHLNFINQNKGDYYFD